MQWFFIFFMACEDSSQKIDSQEIESSEDQDNDGFFSDEDCDDTDKQINPAATEVCDGVDNDCDGQSDEEVKITFYADADSDGFGNATILTEACMLPDGYVTNGSDCDDTEETVYPSAEERCDGLDNDCDEEIDEDLEIEFYVDADSDGFGDDNNTVLGCTPEIGLTTIGGDCNDTDPAFSPIANEICDELDNNCDGEIDEEVTSTFYLDGDEDGYGDPLTTIDACFAPEDYLDNALDCDDVDSEVNPEGIESCDDIDNDCDGEIDEEGSLNSTVWFEDGDEDGYGSSSSTIFSCEQPIGYVLDNTDCDDNISLFNPGAIEKCNGFDDNCDGEIDESTSVDAILWYSDSDQDGFGNSNTTQAGCDQPAGYVSDDTDCDDQDSDVYPGATELCNGDDDDCDGTIDGSSSADSIIFYADTDQDGFGDDSTMTEDCTIPSGHVLYSGDCDDSESSINPSALEQCDTIDNNCNGVIDENTAIDVHDWYPDVDLDGYGVLATPIQSCDPPLGYADNTDDCDDSDASVSPIGSEVCDELDNDCDGSIDESASDVITWYIDHDQDGFGSSDYILDSCAQPTGYTSTSTDCDDTASQINPGAVEGCTDTDNNCDGYIDNDADEDGYSDESCGGSDCDDSDPDSYLLMGYCITGTSCADILAQDNTAPDGLYTIDVDGENTGQDPFEVYCDMTTDDGGWTLVASVATQSSFWTNTSYNSSNGARVQTLGSPDIDQNYVLHLTQWRNLLALQDSSSMLRLTVRRIDNDNDVTLGFLEGIQMNIDGTFQNALAAYDGNMTSKSPTGACVIQYNSNFNSTILYAAFDGSDSACTGYLGWNGACGYPSLGHDGSYANSGSNFSHACSLDNNYYCSSDNMTGGGANFCYFKRKWYWIR